MIPGWARRPACVTCCPSECHGPGLRDACRSHFCEFCPLRHAVDSPPRSRTQIVTVFETVLSTRGVCRDQAFMAGGAATAGQPVGGVALLGSGGRGSFQCGLSALCLQQNPGPGILKWGPGVSSGRRWCGLWSSGPGVGGLHFPLLLCRLSVCTDALVWRRVLLHQDIQPKAPEPWARCLEIAFRILQLGVSCICICKGVFMWGSSHSCFGFSERRFLT